MNIDCIDLTGRDLVRRYVDKVREYEAFAKRTSSFELPIHHACSNATSHQHRTINNYRSTFRTPICKCLCQSQHRWWQCDSETSCFQSTRATSGWYLTEDTVSLVLGKGKIGLLYVHRYQYMYPQHEQGVWHLYCYSKSKRSASQCKNRLRTCL